MVLGRSPDHRRASDVDILDCLLVGAVGPGHGRGKWVEIHCEQIDGLDAVLAHDLFIHSAAPEKSAVDLRMKGFDAASHDFGKAGVLGDFLDGNTVTNQEVGRTSGGEQLDAALLQLARELDDPGLVGDAQQCATYGREQCCPYSLIPNSLSFLRNVPRLIPRMVAARL